MHKKDFAHLEVRIAEIREELVLIQDALNQSSDDEALHVQEAECITSLKKFMVIEENAYKQKSNINGLGWF